MKETPVATIKEIKELVKELNDHCYYYHVLDSPVISDEEYDRLYRRLNELEEESGYILPESPTQRVGAPALEKFERVRHAEPMLSLGNAFSYNELIEFEKRLKRFLKSEEEIVYTVEPKYDGLAIELTYKNGILAKASTRGDGSTGEDVTHNIRTIDSVPLKIETEKVPEEIDIRGEIYMDIKDFESLNKKREEQGEPSFANPRNAAAGSIRQLDSSVTAGRRLNLACYGLGAVMGIEFGSQREFIEWLKSARFPVSSKIRFPRGIESVIEEVKNIEGTRGEFPFEADGAVIKVNDFDLQKKLGVKTREPRWAIAYKFAAHKGITEITEIISSVGRIGTITPVAILEPVNIGGVTVSRSTLHNWDEIERKDIRVGDTVVVERAGDVIPHVVSVIKDKRTGTEKIFNPPGKCPVCGSRVERQDENVAFRCIGLNCGAQVQERIRHYASRAAMDIEGLGEKNVALLYSKGLIGHFSDIYRLKKEDLIELPGFAEKSAQNLIDAIEKSKDTTLARFIYSLGITHVGEFSARLLSRNYKDLEALYNVKAEDIIGIKQMGEKIASSVAHFFNDPENLNTLKSLNKTGFNISNPDFEINMTEKLPFDGLTFVITGTLPRPRNEIKDLIENMGGHLSGSVSGKTSFLVAGESPGSKYEKARSLGIKTISYEELIRLLEERS